MTSTITCPSCGAQTSGKFCAECGQPLAARACANCGASLSARAKFCPECGSTAVAGAPRGAAARPPAPGLAATPGPGDKFPWIIAGVSILALLATVIVVVTRKGSTGGDAAAAATGVGGQATTDLSAMTPREAADRLFTRVASAAETGDTAQVSFFGPMTLQAYAPITPLDADARLHIGLVQLYLGNAAAALAQADTIARDSRTHLFAAVLRAQAATAQGNVAQARTAYQTYLRNVAAERAKSLPEYDLHRDMLTATESEARRVGTGT